MLRAIPRIAIAVAHDAGTACQLGREPFLAVVPGHAASHWQLGRMAEARLAAGAAGRQYAAARPPLAVGMIVTSGSGMESEP
jgi:hypothetical protein